MYESADAEPAALLYVGKANSLKDRVGSYFQKSKQAPKVEALVKLIQHIEVTVTTSETEALLLEYNLIKAHRPRFNVILRDDKSFPYLQLLPHAFPRLNIFRGARNPKGRYFGPFPDARALRTTLNQLQKLFRLRNCRDSFFANRSRPCLQYQIGRCTAPCVGLIKPEEYARDLEAAVFVLEGRDSQVTEALERQMHAAAEERNFERAAELRDQLADLRKLQAEQSVAAPVERDSDIFAITGEAGDYAISLLMVRGGRSLGTTSFFPRSPDEPEAVLAAFLLQHYGREALPKQIITVPALSNAEALTAALLELKQQQVQWLMQPRGLSARWAEAAQTNAEQSLKMRQQKRGVVQEGLRLLGQALSLSETPTRLECFDISHTQGEGTVASCVVLTSEGLARKEYRRFNIQTAVAGDDYAALAEAVSRRYARVLAGEVPRPDVLFVDGGAGQRAAVESALAQLGEYSFPLLVAVAKGADRRPGQERLHTSGSAQPLILPADSAALKIVQRIRDEAHRFAILGHRRRRARRHQESILETVPGLGPAKRRALLQHFGGLQAVQRAGVHDLAGVAGIGPTLAQLIYDQLHPGQ